MQVLHIKHCLHEQSMGLFSFQINGVYSLLSGSWGVGGRRFKSYHADQLFSRKTNRLRLVFLCLNFKRGKMGVKLHRNSFYFNIKVPQPLKLAH